MFSASLFLTATLRAQTPWAWGDNRFGQLGDGTSRSSEVPVRVSSQTGLVRAVGVAAGGSHSLALDPDGFVWAWGSNDRGQLGNGTSVPSDLPSRVDDLSGVIAIAAGISHSLALREDGTLWAWGANDEGQLGDGTSTDAQRPSPVLTSAGRLAGVVAIAAGGGRSMALMKDGTVCVWGGDRASRVGSGTPVSSSVPVLMKALTNIVAIGAGASRSLALDGDGALWACRWEAAGDLFGGTASGSDRPVQIPVPRDVRVFRGAGDHALILTADGVLWTSVTGVAALSRSGAIDLVARSPQVPGLGEVAALAFGGGHVLALPTGCGPVALSPPSLPNGAVLAFYNQVITASGGTPPYTFAVTAGSLPTGLTLNASTGALSGTPTGLGSFLFTITATDASGGAGTVGCSGSQAYGIVVACPTITLSPSSLPNGTLSAPYNQTIAASGGTPPYTYAVTAGSLPPGLSLNASTGVLSGTPTTPGAFAFTVTATDATGGQGAIGCTGSQPYTNAVGCGTITLSPPSLPNATVATAYSQSISASGGTAPYTYAVSAGSLPPGLALNPSTGSLSGAPTATGSFSFTVAVTDARGCTGSQAYSFSVICPTILLAPPSLPGGFLASPYSQTLAASGGTAPYTYAVTGGSLPGGFTLNGTTGLLSGTPATTGSFPFTVTATDASGCSTSQAYTLVLTCPTILLSPLSLPNGMAATPYSQTISASGGTAPYALSITGGSLPPGLTFSAATGALAGIPTTSGAFTFTVTATDANGCTAAKLYTITIITCTLPPVWTPTASLSAPRQGHTATLLPSGKVLVAGGNGSSNPASALASCELYTAAPAGWNSTGSMATARGGHKAVLLNNGKVLVAGGTDATGGALATAELYAPAPGTWSATGAMATARYTHTLTLLPSGKVLVAGGTTGSAALASAQLYDPGTGTWTTTGSMSIARFNHTATLLPNGKVLVAGGTGNIAPFSSAELYDPTAGTWSATSSMISARAGHTATLLAGGKVLVAGGLGTSGLVASAELYDPVAGTWAPTGTMSAPRFYHSETLLLSGKVLVAGGSGGSGFLASSEVYDPTAGTWSASGSMATQREFHTATRLPSGKVLVTGGWKGSLGLSGCELFDPAPCCISTITISPVSLPVSTVSVSYSQRLAAEGGEEPYEFEILEGALPAGLTLEGSMGEISGTPSSAGTSVFTVVARPVGPGGCAGSQTYALAVVSPPVVSSVRKAVPFQLKVSGSNLQDGIKVFIEDDPEPWLSVTWKNEGKIIVGGGKTLKARIPKGVPTRFTFVNPDGGTVTVDGWQY